ncbi:MAG: hypothetical protein ACTSV2_07885 [Candidatus Thorarchaeota archaeon]
MPTCTPKWTSRTSRMSTSFTDNSVLVGDHVVIQNIWKDIIPDDPINDEIVISRISLTDGILHFEKTESSTFVNFDTYELGKNITMSITFTAWTRRGRVFTHTLHNVSFCNFFQPEVQLTHPIGGEDIDGLYIVRWTCTDVNLDDEHFFSIMFSADGGDSFYPLIKNITNTRYVWDSEPFDIRDTYVIQVCAYDNDTAFQLGDTNVDGYWPGLNSSSMSGLFTVGGTGGQPPIHNRDVFIASHPDDSEYVEGSSGNAILWGVSYNPGFQASYSIYVDDVIQQTGYISRYDNVTIAIDGLSPGVHNITLHIHASNDDFDTVLVTVVPISTSHEEDFQFPWWFVLVIIGEASVTILIVLLAIRKRFSKN